MPDDDHGNAHCPHQVDRAIPPGRGGRTAQGGWEYNAVLIAALTALINAGPGAICVDAALGRTEWGPGWALTGLAVGAAAAISLGRRAPAPGDASPSARSEITAATRWDTAGDPVTAEAEPDSHGQD